MSTHRTWIRRLALGLGTSALTLAAGCAVGSGSPDPQSTGAAASNAPSAPAEANEGARIQRFLDGHYRAEDVRHSFRSAMGDDIDCVALEAEPGVRRLLASGVSMEDLQRVPEMPAELAERSKHATLSQAHFNGDLDEHGQARACPAGTAGHVRITADTILAAGGLDAYEHALHTKLAPSATPDSAPPGGANLANYAWVQGGWNSQSNVSNLGGTATLAIASPSVPTGTQDHSLAQIWVTGGSYPTSLQSVEVGWNVDHYMYGASNDPHFFIFSTADAYNNTGCYNNGGSKCLNWVPASASTLVPGATLPSSVPGGAQHEIALTVEHLKLFCLFGHPCSGTWLGWAIWATVDGGASTYVGMYSQSNYGSGALAEAADNFTFGGEVYDQTGNISTPPNVAMGESPIMLGFGSYGYQAYVRNFAYYSTNFALVDTGFAGAAPAAGNGAYTVATLDNTAGAPSWTNWFYYGDYAKPFIIKH